MRVFAWAMTRPMSRMFRANSGQMNIRIGHPGSRSAATHYLLDPAEVAIVLSHIVDLCAAGTRGDWIDYSRSVGAGAAGDLTGFQR